MAKLRHIAIAAKDPDAMAEFYTKAFDFKEVRKTDGPLAYGYHLSDGTIDLAILRFKTDQIGKGLDYTGLHHFGILVDDVEKSSKKAGALGGTHYMDHAGDRAGGFEVKLYGPEGVCSTSPNTPGPVPSRSRSKSRRQPNKTSPPQKGISYSRRQRMAPRSVAWVNPNK